MPNDPVNMVILGDKNNPCLPMLRRSGASDLTQMAARVAEINALQIGQLNGLQPETILIVLGRSEITDGFDESNFHADIVALFDNLQALAPNASTTVVAIQAEPALKPDSTNNQELEAKRLLFNASAKLTAGLKNFQWSEGCNNF